MAFDLSEDVHLALEYGCIQELEEVGEVLRDLKGRAGEVGVVGEVEPHVVNDLGRRHDVHIDFYSVPPGVVSGLKRAKKDGHPEETRYVFVGSGRRQEVAAEKTGWSFREFDEVVDEESWRLE